MFLNINWNILQYVQQQNEVPKLHFYSDVEFNSWHYIFNLQEFYNLYFHVRAHIHNILNLHRYDIYIWHTSVYTRAYQLLYCNIIRLLKLYNFPTRMVSFLNAG